MLKTWVWWEAELYSRAQLDTTRDDFCDDNKTRLSKQPVLCSTAIVERYSVGYESSSLSSSKILNCTVAGALAAAAGKCLVFKWRSKYLR